MIYEYLVVTSDEAKLPISKQLGFPILLLTYEFEITV
jgi:hypothetical protein